jgi:dCMP deaminase
MKELRYMKYAEVAAAMSKDPSTKVGAVAIDDDFRVLATGYNGFPRGVADSEERLCNRPLKYALTVHAEANIVAQSAYSGTSIRGSTVLVSSLFPCVDCAKLLAQAGVKRIIAPKISNERWQESNELAKVIFEEANMEVIEI